MAGFSQSLLSTSPSYTFLMFYTAPMAFPVVLHDLEINPNLMATSMIGLGSFSSVRCTVSKDIWVEVCEEAGERMELTERMSSMIRKYGPHARSSMKDGIWPLVAPIYGFKIGDYTKTVKKNLKIYKRPLDESVFNYEVRHSRMSFSTFTHTSSRDKQNIPARA
ncbi:hypothetical protein B0H14DRAFT_3461516 [Mycena olivaceomarginata]|nr:hypothetical protein B0H14DRAFT_3461516 [Mycena olivaceomarginata]